MTCSLSDSSQLNGKATVPLNYYFAIVEQWGERRNWYLVVRNFGMCAAHCWEWI